MDSQSNSLNWFEIPVTDLQRAKLFYQIVFSIHMEESEMNAMQMVLFPYASGEGKASGALVKSEMHIPSQEGCLIYLNANPSMDAVLERIQREGGKTLMGKTQISPEIGYMAMFVDTEGNKMALHSQY